MAATPIAVITGASSGIGAATARQLAAAGYRVVLTARRKDRIEALAAEINEAGHEATAYALDVTDREAVDTFATAFRTLAVLVNNAGGALGADPVATGDPADWRQMYETNVIGTLNVTQALLPALTASGDGTIVVLSSTAALAAYEGGGGYVAAKHGEHVLAETLRLEIVGTPVRVIEVAPGMVKTEEFATTRFRGDTEKAAKVYAGVDAPSPPTTWPTRSPGPSPVPATSTSTCWWSAPAPRPPTPRSTAPSDRLQPSDARTQKSPGPPPQGPGLFRSSAREALSPSRTPPASASRRPPRGPAAAR